ncbi:hypothetical protein HOS86_gp006 [Klebsiella phage vB_KpnM_KpS110]|uniref:Uncharacterized protein n=4 Tax=Taipeivirus TaxID=2731621 RepID=A0A5Q2F143_9CAUD|nr:hypothetical protein P748_gp011 [Klebsiella phage 0507-KN2-1]YP_009798785.1 hypothetical protein HOS86_gp006 [Klebsiella phage vB_KpnM_KpS110]YP_009883552.1 hypothetical protein HYP92_gp100 [Klebsiella phage Magnus]YP_009884610.1 hypothetical protein HYQ02_gp016 [Klebsiella phage UPM 2146]UJD04820.1 hypothetical protein PWKp5_00077 [Klebsiella phage PWKp5]WJJ58697.1 hypothetical protein MDA2066_orf016 [Klebsiella phage vB_KpnS_MDA2066]WOZ56587.1 hypothetical protein GHCGIGKI_00690 [Klebsie
MKTIKTIITNGSVSFELNTEVSKAEMFRIAQEAGFQGGKTSFMNLLSGKTETACGFTMKDQIVVDQAVVAKSSDKVSMLKMFGLNIHIVEAKTETYGTLNVGKGRVQLNPLNNGTYSVMVFPKKGYDNTDILKAVGGDSKSQYVKMGKLTLIEVQNMIERLA